MTEQNSRVNQIVLSNIESLSFDDFGRNSVTDIVCVAPVRTIVRREEEITLIRRVRKVEEIDASPACPINTTQVSQDGQTIDNVEKKSDSRILNVLPSPVVSSDSTGLGSATISSVESTAQEYGVSTEIAGQTYTEKTTVSSLTELEDVAYGSRSVESQPNEPQLQSSFALRSGTAYVQDCVSNQLSHLYTLDLSTGKATLVGAIATEVTDIAFVGADLYGLSHENDSQTVRLVKIDPATGKATAIGDTGFFVTGLAYNHHRDTLYASSAKQLIAIDIKTGAGRSLLTVARQDYNCGEVAFDRHGKAYITLIGYDRKKLLATCDLYSAAINIIGDIGFSGLGSMEFYGDTLYGVTGNFFELGRDGQLIRIDTTTGAGTLVVTTDPIGRWAGISFYGTDSLSRN